MPRDFSTGFDRVVHSTEAAEIPLVLLEIEHENLQVPIRVVADTADLTSNSFLFQALAFRITLPNDPESGLTETVLELDNVGRELVQWIETADLSKETTVRLMLVRRSAPDNIEWETTFYLDDIEVNSLYVRGRLTYQTSLNERAVTLIYNSQTAPGLR